MSRTKQAHQQAKFLYPILGLFVVLLLNSLLLFVLDFDILSFAYRGSLAFHILAGLLFGIPLLGFLGIHLRKMPHAENRPAMWLGIITAFSVLLTLVSGGLMVIDSLPITKGVLLSIHLVGVATTLSAFFVHLRKRRKNRFHFFVPLTRKTYSRSPHWHTSFKWSLVLPAFACLLLMLSFRPSASSLGKATPADLAPADMQLAHNQWLSGQSLSGSQSCGQSGCHPDITAQWHESAHHFSSFNNPYYHKSIEVLLASNDTEKMRWCASCHDPLLLASGSIKGEGTQLISTHPLREKGITCLVCHGMTGAEDLSGNGNYTLHNPGYTEMEQSIWGDWPALRKRLIRAKPEPHAASLRTPYLLTETYCVSCHKVSIPPAVNNYRWKRGQNQYDAWYASSFSHKHPRAFYTREKKTCVSCHMPSVASSDQGNDDGYVKSHRFAAANTALPTLNHHPNQLAEVQAFLQNDIAEVDVFGIRINGKLMAGATSLPPLQVGDRVGLEVLVSNKNVGHALPAGTNDTNEWWLAVEVHNEAGQPILRSGQVIANQVDHQAHFFRAMLVDTLGQFINKRNVQDWYASVYNTSIPSGMTHIVRYSFEVQAGQDVAAIHVALNQRKFNAYYQALTFEGKEPPAIPITTVAHDSRSLHKQTHKDTPLWKRWNNYGIGLLVEENYQDALKAFDQVAQIQPDLPDGRLNQGRVRLAEGNLSAAMDLFRHVLNQFPENPTATYFLGQAKYRAGAYEEALKLWQTVIFAYPFDRQLLSDMGELHYLLGQYEQSGPFLQRALAIDPEDATTLYRMMLLAGVQDSFTQVQHWQKQYMYYKQNEEEERVIAQVKKAYPHHNLETQAVHYHSLKPSQP